jgi:membrane fusion protein (multidrug efflux system)
MKKIKGVLIALGGLVVVVGALAATKGLQIDRMVARKEAFVPPPATVTVAQVRTSSWETVLTAVGSLQAVQGVVVTAELPGRVARIAFESGTRVHAGALLVQQDVSAELAEQRAVQSELVLARKNYDRATELFHKKVISKAAFDDSKAGYETTAARLDNIRATIAKKTIKAPFTGRLGIRQVNLGEVLDIGQSIVSLQSLDPIYVNFFLPQQNMSDLHKGLHVRLENEAPNGREIRGKITAINSEVDSATRNIRVQATLNNPGEELRPGMYAKAVVVLPEKKPVLAIPITAVHYAPYSDSVFVVEDKGDAAGKVVRQQFVQLGEKNGDFVAVRSGLKRGDTVVSTGVFKLRNGQSVVVDNTVTPEFELKPRPDNA